LLAILDRIVHTLRFRERKMVNQLRGRSVRFRSAINAIANGVAAFYIRVAAGSPLEGNSMPVF
jgi:hypothetical protein